MATTGGSNASAWAEWVAGYPWTSTSILRQPQEQGWPGGSLVRSTLRYPSVPLEVTVKYCLRRRISSELAAAVHVAPAFWSPCPVAVVLRVSCCWRGRGARACTALTRGTVSTLSDRVGIGPLTWMLCLSVERESLVFIVWLFSWWFLTMDLCLLEKVITDLVEVVPMITFPWEAYSYLSIGLNLSIDIMIFITSQ